MKKALIPFIALTLLSLTVLASATTTLSAADVQAAKDAAASIVSPMQNIGVKTDGAGNVLTQTNGNGSITGAQVGSIRDMASQSDYFNKLTGINTASMSADPTKGGRAAAAVSATGAVDISCTTELNRQKATMGYVLRITSCTVNADKVASATLQICAAAMQGGVCEDKGKSYFSDPIQVQANQYIEANGLTIGLGCNDKTKACRVSLAGSFKSDVTGDTLKSQAAAAVTAAGENSAQANLTQTGTSAQYANALDSNGSMVQTCVSKTMAQIGGNGTVTTCDDKQSIQLTDSGTSGAKPAVCQEIKTCTRQASHTASFTRSCTRTLPITQNVCGVTMPSLVCHQVDTWDTSMKVKTTTSSCADSDVNNSTHVGDSTKTCTHSHHVPGTVVCDKLAVDGKTCEISHEEGGTDVCDTFVYDSYQAFTSQETAGSCSANPAPAMLPLSCDTSVAGKAEQCNPGGWFGRTKADAECQFTENGLIGDVAYNQNYAGVSGAGCGICIDKKVGRTCYAVPSTIDPTDNCDDVVLTGCAIAATEPLSVTEGGLVISQKDTYSCSAEETFCAEYTTTTSGTCLSSDLSLGLDKPRTTQKTSDGSLNKAIASAAILNAANQNPGQDPRIPLVFGGDYATCARPTGGLDIIEQNCCRISLERPGQKSGKTNKCTMDEAKLAAERRAHYDVYIGDWCSRRMPWPFKTCLERKEAYCVYQGILPRLIQTQGRQQLADILSTSSSAEIQRVPVTFPYYKDDGVWTAPTQVNGSTISAYQYPTYCSDVTTSEKRIKEDPLAKECPIQLVQWFAVCDIPGGCGALPASPELGSDTWAIQGTDPLKNVTTAMSRYASVKGACDTGSSVCNYEFSSWPAGVGGVMLLTKDLGFPIYSEQDNTTLQLDIPDDMQSTGDLLFRPHSLGGTFQPGLAVPKTFKLDYSINGGSSFMTADIPTDTGTTEVTLPQTDLNPIKIRGHCDGNANLCQYQVTGPVRIQGKPWGPPQGPDCSGFTGGQLSALDFSKMDLSEWLADIMGKVDPANPKDALVSAALGRLNSGSGTATNGTTATSTSPMGAQFARVLPSEGFGPFTVELQVGGIWPYTSTDPTKNTDVVTGVSVDWGDCTTVDTLQPVDSSKGLGFSGKHDYPAPDNILCGGVQANYTHKVMVNVYTSQSGNHSQALQVINAWSTMPGVASSGHEKNTINNPTTKTTNITGK